MEKKRIICLTGAAGFLGQAIIKELQADPGEIRALIMPQQSLLLPGIEVYYGDINSPATLVPFLTHNPQAEELILIHTAALISISSRFDPRVYQTNVLGTQNVIDMAKAFKVKRLVYISSVHALTEPRKPQVVHETYSFDPKKVVGCYAKTKAEATRRVLAAASSDLEVVVLHPSGIIGPGATRSQDNMVAMMKNYVNGDLRVGVHGGYDFVDVRDVAQAVYAASLHSPSGATYILSGHYYTVKQIFDELSFITGVKRVKVYFMANFIRLFAWMAEAYYRLRKKTPVFTGYSMYTLQSKANFSHQKATDQLGFNPRPLRETLLDVIEELRIEQELGFTKTNLKPGRKHRG